MTNVLDALLSLLELKQIEDDHFLGESRDLGFPQVFGGQVLGQALFAACRTVEQGWLPHSLHAYFLRPGAPDAQILYEVDRIRDGRSFVTRRVVARQRRKAIFTLAASFQVSEEGFEHQSAMPSVPGPDGIETEVERIRSFAKKLPDRVREIWTRDHPVEIRVVNPIKYPNPSSSEPIRHAWMRASGKLGDDPVLHRCLLAYASDFQLLGTCLQPHGKTFMSKGMKVASLDHALWFHRAFRFDEWLLYAMDSPSASGARGLNRGSFFDQSGNLVASVAQEGLIRYVEAP
jgi:acyl-CoA thioesterase II